MRGQIPALRIAQVPKLQQRTQKQSTYNYVIFYVVWPGILSELIKTFDLALSKIIFAAKVKVAQLGTHNENIDETVQVFIPNSPSVTRTNDTCPARQTFCERYAKLVVDHQA